MNERHGTSIVLTLGSLLFALLGNFAGAVWAVPIEQTTFTQQVTPSWTPSVDVRPDGCEPNDVPEQACVLVRNTSSATLTLLPDGDVDYYSINLGEERSQATTITVRGTSGLDLLTTITRAGEVAPLTTISSPAISATVQADVVGWLVLRVENLAPEMTMGETYRIEVRTASPPPAPSPTALAGSTVPTPDLLENNYDAFHAAPIALNTVYDLNFACPVVGACAGGDHDYLRVPVKAGLRYLLATFDLGPGVDTVLDVFWNDESQPVAGNDDFAPGGLLSLVQFRAADNGDLLVRVGPRNGGVRPMVDDEAAQTYRVIVALADSELAQDITELVREQTNAPEPTPTAAPASPSAAPAGSAPQSLQTVPSQPVAPTALTVVNDAPTGGADVIAEDGTALREGPGLDHTSITTLPQNSIVTLLGEAAGAWVRVQPMDSVVPGWVYGPALQPHTPLLPNVPNDVTTPTDPDIPSLPSMPNTSTTPNTTTPIGSGEQQEAKTTVELRVTREQPAPTTAPLVAPRVPLTAKIRIQSDTTPAQPLSGLRVQLVNVFGDVLTEVVTDQFGAATFTRDVPPHTLVLVQIPRAGLTAPLDLAKPDLTITIPTGGAE